MQDADRTPTDEELAARARRGSLAAFGVIVERYEHRLFNFVVRRVGNAADAEDVTQEAFVRAWRHIRSYRPRWRFSTWLFTIAGRVAIDHRRAAARRPAPAPLVDPPGREDEPDRALGAREHAGQIWRLADRLLDPVQRTAIWLRYGEDMPVRDIARILGRTPVSTRVLLHRAREQLAEAAAPAPRRGDEGIRRPPPLVPHRRRPIAGGLS